MSFLARRAFAATQRAATTPLATTTPARAFSASARREIAKITLVGNLAAQPELKTTGTGRMRYLKDVSRKFKNGFRTGVPKDTKAPF